MIPVWPTFVIPDLGCACAGARRGSRVSQACIRPGYFICTALPMLCANAMPMPCRHVEATAADNTLQQRFTTPYNRRNPPPSSATFCVLCVSHDCRMHVLQMFCVRDPIRVVLSVWSTGRGGGMRAKKFCVPTMGLSFFDLYSNFIFFSEEKFLGPGWVCGCVVWRRGWGPPDHPPPRG